MFSDKDRRSLESNPLVQSVGPNQVQFTAKFKLKALKLHAEGLRPSDIFLKLGVDPNLFLKHYPKKCLTRWKKIVETHGEIGLEQERRGKGATGRPRKAELKDEKALLARIAYLEAENDFLKKLRALAEEPESKKRTR
jgi:transposase